MMHKNYYFLGVALILSFVLDDFFVRLFLALRNNFIDSVVFFFASEFFIIYLAVILSLVMIWMKKKTFVKVWISMGVAYFVGFVMKNIFMRVRPFEYYGFGPAVHDITSYAFPSGHAIVTFSILPFLDKYYPKYQKIWWGFACLILVMRIYAGVHYLSDILFGAVIGYFIGWYILKHL